MFWEVAHISHQSHKKEWNLENIVLDKIQALDDIIVPSGMLKVQNEGQEPKQHFYANNLDKDIRQRQQGLSGLRCLRGSR
jgi:hypothetical protein